MSLLSSQYLKSTVYLTKDNTHFWTWFLIWIETWKTNEEGKKLYYIFLVTNRHNITDGKILKIRFNKQDWNWTGEETVNIEKSDRIYYTDVDDIDNPIYTDVVMLQLNFGFIKNAGYETHFIIEENIFTDRYSFENNLKIWHEIFLLWFPLGIKGLNSNFPIARQWIIARNDKELLDKREIYLDVNNFPWNSWWPIVLKPNRDALEWKPILESKLIGVIKSYSPYYKTYHDISTNPPTPTVMISENSWIAQGIPSYIIYEMWKEHINKTTKNTLFDIQEQKQDQ